MPFRPIDATRPGPGVCLGAEHSPECGFAARDQVPELRTLVGKYSPPQFAKYPLSKCDYPARGQYSQCASTVPANGELWETAPKCTAVQQVGQHVGDRLVWQLIPPRTACHVALVRRQGLVWNQGDLSCNHYGFSVGMRRRKIYFN